MKRRGRAVLLLLLWACPAGAVGPAAAVPPALPKAIPLTMPQIVLLSQHKFEVHADGSVWERGASQAVSPEDMPAILARLESTQRLTALLRLRLILSGSDGERYLSPSEREQIRAIIRDNWPYFTMRMRKGFRGYFSLRELEEMNRIPPAEEGDVSLEMKDPDVDVSQDESDGGSPFAPPTAAAQAAAQPAPPPPLPAAPAPTPSPAAPAVAAEAIPAFASQPTIVAAPGTSKAAAAKPGAAEAQAKPAEPTAPPAMPDYAAVPLPPAPHPVSADDFLRFLSGGAYTPEVRGLLKLISDYAPDYARDRALGSVVDVMPLIMVDSARTGFQARGNLMVQQSPSGDTAYAITLSAGPAIYVKKRLFTETTALLPDSPRSYAAIHLPAPAVEALKPDAAALKEQKTEWGQTKLYSDGSRRGSFSDASMAGTLLRNLLRLDAHRFGWDASPYAAELYARQAQMLFYAAVAAKMGGDDFLDPDLRAAYRQWLEHPAEFRDFVVHTIASGRTQLLDPRKGDPTTQAAFDAERLAACPKSLADDNAQRLALNRTALEATAQFFAGLGLAKALDAEVSKAGIDADLTAAAKKMGQPSMDACARLWEGEASGLKQAAALLSEMQSAEAKFRSSPPSGASHAP